MNKIRNFIKPYVLLVFGALLFLFYLNWLSLDGILLAIGIIAVVVSGYYLAMGVLSVVLIEKLNPQLKQILNLVNISLFPLFIFIRILLITINFNGNMNPTGWVIAILSMIASLALAIIYLLEKLTKNAEVKRFTFLSAVIFVVALLANILFDATGTAVNLGNVNIVVVLTYVIYSFVLFNSFGKDEEPLKEDREAENPVDEVKPVEEEKAVEEEKHTEEDKAEKKPEEPAKEDDLPTE